jgi:hypothetical protein
VRKQEARTVIKHSPGVVQEWLNKPRTIGIVTVGLCPGFQLSTSAQPKDCTFQTRTCEGRLRGRTSSCCQRGKLRGSNLLAYTTRCQEDKWTHRLSNTWYIAAMNVGSPSILKSIGLFIGRDKAFVTLNNIQFSQKTNRAWISGASGYKSRDVLTR